MVFKDELSGFRFAVFSAKNILAVVAVMIISSFKESSMVFFNQIYSLKYRVFYQYIVKSKVCGLVIVGALPDLC